MLHEKLFGLFDAGSPAISANGYKLLILNWQTSLTALTERACINTAAFLATRGVLSRIDRVARDSGLVR